MDEVTKRKEYKTATPNLLYLEKRNDNPLHISNFHLVDFRNIYIHFDIVYPYKIFKLRYLQIQQYFVVIFLLNFD